jgi:hypothetical protein
LSCRSRVRVWPGKASLRRSGRWSVSKLEVEASEVRCDVRIPSLVEPVLAVGDGVRGEVLAAVCVWGGERVDVVDRAADAPDLHHG